MTSPTIIIFDYVLSPYAAKIRLLLDAAGIPFKRCDQPMMMPRPDLKALGISYRRIPVLAIGKDVYCDTSCIVDVIQSYFPEKALPTSPADEAYNAFSSRTFQDAMLMIPDLKSVGEAFLNDRKDIFPTLLRPDFADHRPSALASFKAVLDIVENEFLGDRAWIGGDQISLADINIAWIIRMGIEGMRVKTQNGFGPDIFPKTYKWLAQLPSTNPEVITAKEASKIILEGEYISSISIDATDPLSLGEGSLVSIETVDDTSGEHSQLGKLIGLSRRKVTVLLDNGIRLHFPRIGFCVKPASNSPSSSSL